ANEPQIEASFCEAIRIAKEQKSISLQKRAEASYAEYRRRKHERLGHGLPPEKISVARLPVTGSDIFGRERTSRFWIAPGQTRMSTSLQSLPGRGWESPRSLTIGSDGWLLKIIVLRSLFLAGLSTDRAPPGRLRQRMNSLTRLSTGLEIQIHGLERRGRRARDSRSLSRIHEPCLFWMAWSRCQIPLVRKRDGCVSLPSSRFYANLLPSIGGVA